jgi:hypothetical protein
VTSGKGLQIIIPKKKPLFRVMTSIDPSKLEAVALEPVGIGPMDPLTVEAHKAKYKLSMVCANCTHWYEGAERQSKVSNGDPRCSATSPCGGLAVRRGYPEYKGPMTDEYLERHCVVCEEEAPRSVSTPDGKRRGYCTRHLESAMKLLGGM